MCKNATATAASLMKAIEPTIQSILTLTGQANTQAGLAAIAAYNAALTALENWQSGTDATEVLELIGALQSALNAVFTAVPISPELQALINVILAGVETVIGVLTANSPAPPAETGTDIGATQAAAPHDVQAAHQAFVAADTTAKVQALVPGFKRSIFHSPESQYKSAWNKAVDENNLPATLKAA
jgi:hypothetical protein